MVSHISRKTSEMWGTRRLFQPLANAKCKRHPPFVIPSEPGFPATMHRKQQRMRFSVGENRIKFANATNLDRKSGVAEGPAVSLNPQTNSKAHRAAELGQQRTNGCLSGG